MISLESTRLQAILMACALVRVANVYPRNVVSSNYAPCRLIMYSK